MTENFTELLITLFSSAGLAGALFAALLSHVLKKARADADQTPAGADVAGNHALRGRGGRRRAAADARRVRTGTLRRSGTENARDEYSSFLEKSRALKAKLAAEHTEH